MADTRSLPNIALADVQSHNTEKSCYVTVGSKVYDVTDFLDSHPGGGELILEWAGKDVTAILKDSLSHEHSDAAYEILDESLVGLVATDPILEAAKRSDAPDSIVPLPPNGRGKEELARQGVKGDEVLTGANGKANGKAPVYAATGMSGAEDLSVETDTAADFKTHKFLDLERPLLMQVWRGGFSRDFYLEQVHRPRHYRGGASAPLFGNFLEPLSLTPWWVVPTLWLPPIAYGLWEASMKVPGGAPVVAAYWGVGVFIWTLVEYCLHRFLFHIEAWLPDNRVGVTLHFLLHGIHHYLPMDRMRLVMPPALLVVLATPFWRLAHTLFSYDYYVAQAVFCGGLFGYVCYDLTHYFLHHRNLPSYYRELKKYHLQHHFADYDNGFGVTSRIWDRVFGTELVMPQVVKTK